MKINLNNNIIKFRAFMFLYWAMILSVTGMYTMYIAQLGFSKKEISIIVTIHTISTLLGQNTFGYLVDKFKRMKRILFLSISIGILIALLLIYAKLTWQIYILMFLWGFFLYGTVPLTEVWCMENLKGKIQLTEFGTIRGFGSIGYGLSGVTIGLLLNTFGWKIYYGYILVSVCLTLLAIMVIQQQNNKGLADSKIRREKIYEEISIKEVLKETIKIKPLRAIILIVFIYTFVVRGIYSYLGVLLVDFGGGPLSLGLTYFFDATPEVLTFFLTAKLLRKYQGKNIIFVAFVLQIIRLSFILVFNNAISVILLGMLSGFAFGLLASSYKTAIYQLAPPKYKTTCMSLSESIIGFSGILSAPLFGFVFTRYGGRTAIALCLLIYIITAGFMLKGILNERMRKEMNTL